MSTNNYSFVGDQRQRLSDQRKATQTAPVEPATQAAPTATDSATTLTDREQIAQSIDQQLAQIDSTFNANKDRWAAEKRKNTYSGSMGMFAQPSQFTVAALPEEQKQLEAARMELAKAKKALNTYTENDQAQDIKQGKEKGFFEEIGTGLKNTTFGDVASIFTLGYSDTQNTSKINAALRKASQGEELTNIERSMVEAVGHTQKAQKYVQDNGGGTILSSIGEGIPTTAGYMLETGVFGGNMLSAARNAATKGAAAFGKAVLKEAAVEVVRTPFRGSMTSKIIDLDTDQYSVEDDSSVVKGDPSSFAEKLWKGYVSTFAEGFSERIGNVIPSNIVGRGLGRVVPKLMGAKAGAAVMGATDALAANTKQFRDFMRKATGYNGTVDEFLEEEFNNIVEPLLTLEPERIKDNFTLKNQAVTLGSVAVMGATMHTMSLPSTIAVASDKSKMRRGINTSIRSIEIPTLRQDVYNATKKGVTIEDRAKDLANLDWANMSVADRANTIDAFNKSIVLDIYSGFELSRKTEEMTAQKIQTWNVIYQQSANTDTGAIEELADEQDNRYLLLAGSLEDQGTDETLFVRNAQTGMTEQIGRSSVRRVGEAETYESGLRKIVEQSATQASEQILDEQSAQEDQDAQEIGVQSIAYNFGDNVTLADGRQGQFLGYHNDGSNIAQVAFVDQQTGEQESAEVPKSHIVGFAYPNDASQREPAQELPNVEQSEQSGNAQQELPSESVQREIPTTKDGAPDYDAMPADMYLEEYSKIASRDEALDDLRGEKIALDKQIKKLQSSNNATSRNTKIANRAKVSGLQTKVDDITRVLQENTPKEAMAAQAEQSVPKPTSLKHSMLDLGDYVSVEDYILRDIASGLKFRWSDDGAKRGLAKELGFENSNQERKSRIGILQNDGTTIDRYAESISGLLGNAIPAFSVDEQDIRSAVIDVLGSVSSPAQAAAKVRALHADSFDEQANDYYLGELEKYKLEVAEYDAALDLWVNELSEADFAEIDALFESELLTLRDQITDNDGYNQTNPRRTAVAQDATAETGEDQSRQGGDNGRAGDQNIDPRGKTKESTTRQDDQRVDDPISSAQTQVQKYEAVKDYVEQLNQLSGADAVVFSRLEQLPDDVAIEFEAQWRAEPGRVTPGVMIKGEVYIYAPHIESTTDLILVYNHEVAGHKFISKAIQTTKEKLDFFNAIVDHIGIPAMRDLKITELADEVERYENGEISKWQLGREYIAYLTQDNYTTLDYGDRAKEFPLYVDLSQPLSNSDLIKILKSNNNGLRIIKIGTGESLKDGLYDTLRSENQQPADRGRNGGSVVQNENPSDHYLGEPQTAQQGVESVGQFNVSRREGGAEIRQEDVRGAGRDEQTDSSTDARWQAVGDPISSAQTQEQKYEAVKDYVAQLNQLSGADAVVFSRLEQLPDDVAIEFEAQWRAEPNQETPGVTIGTKVYLYAPHIKDAADLEVVFNHEVAAHRNVLLALGQDRKAEVELYSAVVDGIGVPKMLQLIEDPVFSELADLYFGTSTQSSKIELGKEFVGYFTEKHFNKKEYSNVGAGKLSLNLSEKITIEDVTNILNTANRKGNEQRITIKNSRNGSGQVAYEKDDTRNMGQDRAGQTSDLAGRGSGTSLALENTVSDLSRIQKNPTHSKNGNGGSTESDSNSGTEIRQENVGGVGGDEQTDSSTDARSDGINPDIRFRQIEPDNTAETEQIKAESIERGDFLKAPNGEQTNLTEHQWLQVRTAAFKEWFGDWEKAARIEKLHKAESVEITGNEISNTSDRNILKPLAERYGLDHCRGEFLNRDTGSLIAVVRDGIRETVRHGYDISHLQSVAAIPDMISSSVYITSLPNTQPSKKSNSIVSFDYYVVGLSINGVNYTAKLAIGVDDKGHKFYDHALTQIEKSDLISQLGISVPINEGQTAQSVESKLDHSNLSDIKDKRLISILQTNSSKVVDANGEPMVVYHGSDSDFYEFSHDKISNQEGSFFFAQNIEDAEGYSSGALIEAFVNLRNPANFEDLPLEVLRLNDKKAIVERLKPEGYDGWVEGLKDGWGEISAFNPNQIKSATENTGDFSSQNNDIRYSDQSLLAETQSQHEYEQNKAKTYVNAEKRKAQVAEQLQKLTAKFGVETVIANSAKELPQSVRYRTRNARFGGLYDKQDGKVYFVASEIRDADDATATFLHEVVSHKGIDALMGREGANQFYASVFDCLPQKEQARLLAKYDNKVEAGDELVARMAEGNVTPSVMQRVIAAVRKFFREVLGLDLTISDNDIRYVLWKSKNNLERASALGEVFSVIERDKALRAELYPPNKSLMDQVRQVATESRTRVISQEVDQKENADFNADLSRYASSLMKANEYLHVGLPSGALSQILPRLPIVVKQGVITKAIAKKHNLTIDSLENLPAYLSNPIFIFSRDDRSVGVLTDIADKEGKNTCVAIRINTLMQNGKEFVEVNDITTIHGRDAENIISPIVHNNSLIWADKRKGLNWLSSAQLNGQEIDNQNLISATKIIENYQNSTLNDLRYRKPVLAIDKKGNEYLRLSGEKGGWGSNATQTSEKFVDQYVKVKYLVDEVRRRGGDVNILNNVYDELNLKDSKASAATDHYADDFFEPLMNHFKYLGKYKFQYKQISDYINAKSSIERDESGTSALGKDPKGKWTKSTAQKIVDKFETVVEEQDVAKLWDLWRNATSQPLQIAGNSGRISLSELKQIQSKDWQYYAPLRGKDFDFEGVQDMREVFYLNSNQRYSNTDISKAEVTKRALGRTSKAADPVAALIHMTNQEIYLSQENKALRYLLRLVEANHEMKDLFELKKVYYEKIGDDWIELEGTPNRAKMEATHNARLAIMRYHKELKATSDIGLMNELIDKISAEQDKITITSREAEAKHKGYTGASKYAGDVAIMKDGVKYIVQIKDPEVAGAINYKPDGLQRGLSNTIGRGTRFMGMMKTSKNPAFIGSNKARDFVGGAFYNYVHRDGDLKGFLKHSETHYGAISRRIKGKASLLDVAQLGGRNILDRTDRSVLAKIYGKKQVEDTIYDLFVLSGGLTGYFHNPDVKEHQKKSERNIKRKSKRYYLGKGLNSLNKGIDYLSEVAENSTRFAAFMAQIDNGANVPSAIKHAKNVSVNFNRKGRYSKGIGAAILFFNATMQGVKRLYDLFMGEADYTNRERWAQRGRFALATVVGASIGYWSTVMVKSMLRGLIGDDDQEYMVSLYERCTNLLIPVSGTKGGYVKIPIDISLRPAYGLGVLLSDWQDGLISKQDVVDNFLQMMAANVYPIEVNVFNPLGLKNQVLGAITPSVIEPLADIGNNRDFTGNTIFREAPYSPHTPQSQLGKRNANVYLVSFTKWLNEFFGGNEFTPAGVNIDGTFNWRNMFDLNPSKLEHIFSQYFAGVGKTANDLIVTLSSIKNGTEIEARKIPIANRFYGEAYEKDPSKEYYDIKKNIERVNRNNKKAKELGVRSAIFAEDEFSTKYVEYEKYGKAIKELERKTRPIKEKLGQMQFGSQEYDLLKSQMDRLHRQFIKQYNDQRN